MFNNRPTLDELALKASRAGCGLVMNSFIDKNPSLRSIPVMAEFKRLFQEREEDLEAMSYKDTQTPKPSGFADKLLKYFNLPVASHKYWNGTPEWTAEAKHNLRDLFVALELLDEKSVCVEFIHWIMGYYGEAVLNEVVTHEFATDDMEKGIKTVV